jgi:hypothetical protein
MLENSRRTIAAIAGAIGLTFAVGVAAAAGVVPQADSTEQGAPAAAVSTDATPAATEPVANQAAPAEAPVVAAAPAAPAAPSAPRSAASAPRAAPAATAAAAPAPPSTVPARRNPSSAEVMGALQTLKARIPMMPLNESYARDFGNQVCSAFDAGSSFSQVVNNAIAAASKVPFFSLSQADAQFAVRTAVQLFCPGYAAKLG